MNILIKTTLRNIIGKPLRSLLVIFSIFVCSITALFCFDLANSNNVFLESAYKVMAGDADFTMSGDAIDLSQLPEDFPEYNYMTYRLFTEYRYIDIEGEYYVVHADRIRITSTDVEKAADLNIIQTGLELGDGQVIVTQAYANALECEVGDMITVHDKNGDPLELEVSAIVPTGTMNIMRRGRSLIVNENTGDVLCAGRHVNSMQLVNIIDDSKVSEAERILNATYPDASINRLTPADSMLEGNEELMGFMFLIFAIAFLLVIFITASLCERIVSERMSYIGTLRSLGLSARVTGGILLIENVFYGLIGSIPGTILYIIFRDMIMGLFFTNSTDLGNDIIPALSPLLVAGVILGAVIIECIIPLRAQLKALKVSIRDIIFDNRDTEYKFSRTGITLGIILAITGIVTFFLRSKIFAAGVCLIAFVMAAAFLYPVILRQITNIIRDSSRKADKEPWALAAVETGTRKSAVGSGILSVSSTAMCIIILSIAISLMGSMASVKYDCDVVITTTSESTQYSFVDRMDGVTASEFVYKVNDSVRLGEDDCYAEFYGIPEGGFEMYNGFAEMPEVTDGMIAIENSWAKKNGINVGDVLTIVFNPTSVFPIEKEFTVAGFFKNLAMANAETAFVITQDDFINVYHDMPGQLLIRCDDPDQVADMIETYAVGLYDDVKTSEEILAADKEDQRTSVLIFTAIIVVAVGMTLIGMTSNQLIGFEGRKKECAVMISTAMSKKTLTSILFRESLLSAVISCTIGILTGSLLVLVIKDALSSSAFLYITIIYNPLYTVLLWLVMIAVFALTVLFPVRSLNKMKISEQIKCE